MKIVVSTTLAFNQNGARNSKKTTVTFCTTKIRTMEKLRVKNGIWLTMNSTEHTGWIIVDAGLMNQAQTSAVTMARTVAPLLQRKNTKYALPNSRSTSMSPVKKSTLTKRAPGSTICAHPNNNTT